jgi:two-component system response regulator NreC
MNIFPSRPVCRSVGLVPKCRQIYGFFKIISWDCNDLQFLGWVSQLLTLNRSGKCRGGFLMKVITLLILSDESIPRLSLERLLASEAKFDIKGVAGSEDAIQQASTLNPDVIIVFAQAARPTCTQLIGLIRNAAPHTGIVVLGREIDDIGLGLLLAAGALGYVFLRSTPQTLFNAICAAFGGRRFIDPSLNDDLIESLALRATSGTKQLSRREDQVLRMLAYGHTLKEIASYLHISPKSIETYRVRTQEKLGLHTRADFVRYALDTGLMTA